MSAEGGLDLDEVVADFLVECHENLELLDRELVELERGTADRATVSSIFRIIHTIKGTPGFFGFDRLQSVTHVGENLLSRLREQELQPTPEIVTALLAMVDAVREMLAVVESSRGASDGEETYPQLVARIELLTATADVPPAEAAVSAPRPAAVVASPPAVSEPSSPAHRAGKVTDSSIRVDVHALDRIVNLVSELVLARNEILQLAGEVADGRLSAASQRLDVIAGGLQDEVMRTRMHPIGQLFGKFPRVVRDLAISCGREVRLVTSGTETELDRTVIDAIRDPLTHLIRNAVDHGIEPPEERSAAGKPTEGRLGLHAYHQNGQVVVEVGDDGAGIYPSVIRQKAVQKGLLTPESAAACSDEAALQLIFLPGFSTAVAVTGISGRGVGMDVVKTSIEGVGGTVDVLSTPGTGTTFRIRIPLTLAVIPALVVRSAGAKYAVPTADVVELVGVGDGIAAAGGEGAANDIERVHDAEVYRLRGELLPLLDLSRALTGACPRRDGPRDILVLRTAGRRVGLVVDQVLHTSEIVVKPLGSLLQAVPVVAGATILGDGSLALILDLLGLLAEAELHALSTDDGEDDLTPKAGPAAEEDGGALLCQVGGARLVAVPLDATCRLEEFPDTAVEWADGREVVQYRGALLPLIRLRDVGRLNPAAMGGPEHGTAAEAAYLQVIVCPGSEGDIGLAVEHVVDLVTEPIVVLQPSSCLGVAGSGIVRGAVTDVIDVEALLELHSRGTAQLAGAAA